MADPVPPAGSVTGGTAQARSWAASTASRNRVTSGPLPVGTWRVVRRVVPSGVLVTVRASFGGAGGLPWVRRCIPAGGVATVYTR